MSFKELEYLYEAKEDMIKEKKIYLTKEKFKEIQEEEKRIKKLSHRKIQEEAPAFLHSEEVNPEYIYFREEIDLLRIRMAEINNILKNAEVIKIPPPEKRNEITLGATVQAIVDGKIDEFMIVGTIEANPLMGKISNESPVGRALMGKKVGEIVFVSSPIKIKFEIKQIKYEL